MVQSNYSPWSPTRRLRESLPGPQAFFVCLSLTLFSSPFLVLLRSAAITVLLVIVSHVVDIKAQHHRVVFVNRVVAVHRVTSDKVAEPEVDLYVVTLAESYNVLTAALDQRGCVPVALENLVFLEVNMDWVRPIKSTFEIPNLGRVTFHSETNIVAIKELIVDYPLTVLTIKLEAALDTLGHPCRYLIESGVSGRVTLLSVTESDTTRNSSTLLPWPAERMLFPGPAPSHCS